VTCSGTTNAADGAALTSALGSAQGGSCVLLTGSSYDVAAFDVPAGVTLTAPSGTRVTITQGPNTPGVPVPLVSLGEGSGLVGVDVSHAQGVAIAVRAKNATITDVHVTNAANAAIAAICSDASCSSGTIALKDVVLSKSALGLWASGAHVVWNGGSSSEHASTSLAAAFGVVGQDGAKLELTNVTVEKNEGTGVLVDGAATTMSLTDSNVQDNGERGVWAQKVSGTIDAPAVTIKNTNLVRNKIVGVGSVEAHGIIIVGGRIAETVAAPVVTNLDTTEQIGDGVGIFSGTSDVKIDQALVEQNARAAGVVDGTTGIIIVGGKISAGTSGLKFVVQNTSDTTDVQIADADKSAAAKPLGVSAPKLALPPVL
jgi:hypothetical protein